MCDLSQEVLQLRLRRVMYIGVLASKFVKIIAMSILTSTICCIVSRKYIVFAISSEFMESVVSRFISTQQECVKKLASLGQKA